VSEELRAAFDALYEAACETRDADAIVAAFATDDDVTLTGSDEEERAVGPDELRAIADAIASGPSFRFEWSEQRFRVEGDVAWVNATGELVLAEDGSAPKPA
jgi:ketosteroid isomerase-like protein